VPPRSKRELFADALGVLAFALLIPIDVALYTKEIFSFSASQHWGWDGAIVAALSLAVYAWPYRSFKSPDQADLRIWWWTLPFALSLLAMTHAVHTRHPYLNPFNPDRDRLAAERVLSLKNNVVAGAYADWVLRYARDLDERGDTQGAIHFYREGLRLNPNHRDAYARLVALESQAADIPEDNGTSPAPGPEAAYWTADSPITPSPRRHIDAQLENVERCTVVIVPVGEVPDTLLDAVGYAIHHELDLPVYVSPDAVPLPPHTRVRGLVTGPQWDAASLVQAFTNSISVFPRAPVKYLLVTPVDIYIEDANYVFSSTGAWGTVLSFARFGGPNGDDSLLRQRTAKQALGALLKSFNIPASTDRNDVTSYTSSLEEFDAKGNRPNAETLRLFRQAIADINHKWQNYLTKQRG
jgi:predicted Zn-dependent protease